MAKFSSIAWYGDFHRAACGLSTGSAVPARPDGLSHDLAAVYLEIRVSASPVICLVWVS